jgi:Tol biopolymer transport system component
MAMHPGNGLGPYSIVGLLGAGGMGEVYRATDTKLNRDVAIKVLPAELAEEPERLARFEREAKLLASLNHPNIAHVYGFESATLPDGSSAHFLAMELVEGEELAERLKRGPIPLDEALEIAKQIAEALEEAHEHGIVHRDLKPANVKLTADGKVKVLDFGLAKAYAGESATGSSADLSQSPTLAHSGTQAGVILGTAAYMSPEQARGKPVDKRSDIWAFGVLLHEMLTGGQLFAGETVSDVLAGVLKTEVDLASLPDPTPPVIRQLLRRCLERNPKNRLHDIADARLAIDEVLAGGTGKGEVASGVAGPRRGAVALTVALALLAGIGVGYRIAARREAPAATNSGEPGAPTFRRLTFQPGEEDDPALSPDGKTLFFVMAGPKGDYDIFFLPVGGRKPIDLTADSSVDDWWPAVSPDGSRIAFRSERDGGGIFLMGVTGESVRRLAGGCFDPAWSPDGKSIACTSCPQDDPFGRGCRGKLRVVDVGTGHSREIDTYDAAAPAWSPDGKHIAYWGLDASESGWRDLYLVDAAGGESIELTHDVAVDWNPIWSDDGAALDFLSDRGGSPNLWRLPLDVRTGRPSAPPRSMLLPTELAGRVCHSGNRWAYVSLALRATIGTWAFDPDRLVARGAGATVLATAGRIFTFSLSPDARSIAYTTMFPRQDLFVVPTDGGPPTQLTDDVAVDRFPSWDPNGRRILFMSNRGGRYEFWAIGGDGSGLEQLTRTTGESRWNGNLSPDRRRLSGVSRLGTDIFDATGPPPWEHYEHLVDPANRASSTFQGYVWSQDGQRLAGVVTTMSKDNPRVAVWSFRDRKLHVFDLQARPIAWLADDRRLLVQLRSRGSVSGLVTVDPETAKTEPVDAADVKGWDDLAADRALHTLLGFRNDAEADIWLAEGLR